MERYTLLRWYFRLLKQSETVERSSTMSSLVVITARTLHKLYAGMTTTQTMQTQMQQKPCVMKEMFIHICAQREHLLAQIQGETCVKLGKMLPILFCFCITYVIISMMYGFSYSFKNHTWSMFRGLMGKDCKHFHICSSLRKELDNFYNGLIELLQILLSVYTCGNSCITSRVNLIQWNNILATIYTLLLICILHLDEELQF